MRLNNEEIVTSVREKNCMVIGIVTGKELNKKRNFAIYIIPQFMILEFDLPKIGHVSLDK